MGETWKQLYTRIGEDCAKGAEGWAALAKATADDDPAAAENAYRNADELAAAGRRAGRFADLLPDDA